jgi:hypothetical protein
MEWGSAETTYPTVVFNALWKWTYDGVEDGGIPYEYLTISSPPWSLLQLGRSTECSRQLKIRPLNSKKGGKITSMLAAQIYAINVLRSGRKGMLYLCIFLCTGAPFYAPYSVLLISKFWTGLYKT